MENNSEVEVVISGIGCDFPKAKNIENFKEMLLENQNGIDTARWPQGFLNVAAFTGNVDNLDNFDSAYFGIHRQQTFYLDCVCKKTLENAFEAIFDAGINPVSLRGKKVGVFAAATMAENDSMLFSNIESGFGLVGQARTMMSNRLSYWLNVTGPSFCCDNTWVGGFQVLKNGYEVVKSGLCEAALVCTGNSTQNPFLQKMFVSCECISSDGKTKAFDENSEGYVRSDGFCVFFLQPAHLARRSYATIVNVEVEFNGNRTGDLTVYEIDYARKFLSDFYQRANVPVSKIEYLEAYGSGIRILDEFEINVVDQVFKPTTKKPLLIGSVKSNIGHSEASSSLCSVIKAIIAMKTGIIPANLNYNGNKNISALRDGRIQVVTENKPWSGTYAAINAIGLSTVFGHVLLKQNNETNYCDNNKGDIVEKFPFLYTIASRTEEGVQNSIEQIRSHPTENFDYMQMINDVFLTQIPGYLYRGYIIRNTESKTREEILHYSGVRRPIWFVYSGMGSQWCTMGKDLLRLPIFAKTIHRCHETLKPHGVDLYRIITENDATMFDNILNSFVGIAAIQIALTDLLTEMGIKPDNIIGHSVGELGCAYADGCLTAEQMILAAYYRGRASIEVDLEPGLMAAVGIGASAIRNKIPVNVDIACHNGPESCTLSGPEKTMRVLVKKLQEKDIFARLVNVAGIAYHSRYIKPAAPLLLNYLKQIISSPKPRSYKWYSTSVPEASWDTEQAKYVSPEYLTNNLLSSVYFEEVLKYIPREAVVIEIAPHGLMQAILRRSLPLQCISIPLTKRDEPQQLEVFLSAVGKMFSAGLQINVNKLYAHLFKKDSSNSIVTCSREIPSLAPLVHWAHNESWPFLVEYAEDSKKNEINYEVNLGNKLFSNLVGHRIHGISTPGDSIFPDGTNVIPFSTYLVAAKKILNLDKPMILFENIFVKRSRFILDDRTLYVPSINIMYFRGTGYYEVNDRYGVISTGRVNIEASETILSAITPTCKYSLGEELYELTAEEFYAELSHRGHEFQKTFRAIHHVNFFKNGMTARIEWTNEWSTFLAVMTQLGIYRAGQNLYCPLEIAHIDIVACNFNKDSLPKIGTILDVSYNYVLKTITSSIIIIKGVYFQPYKLEKIKLTKFLCYSKPVVQKDKIEENKNDSTIIKVCETDLNFIDMESKCFVELKKILDSNLYKNVYLFSKVIPSYGIDSFLECVKSFTNEQSVSLVYALDTDAPDFNNVSDPFYQSVIKESDKNVHIYYKGKWEHKKTIILDNLETCAPIKYDFLLNEKYIKQYSQNIDIHYLGINPFNMIIKDIDTTSGKLGIMNYSGIDRKNNQRVMGISFLDESLKLCIDPILQWPIPENWSLLEASTVPFSYALAYYIFDELVWVCPGERILIHNGCSNVGLALIQITMAEGYVIYTTVKNEKQRNLLQEYFPEIPNSQIFDYTSANLEQKILLATNGEGMNIIISCFSGKRLHSSLRSASESNRVVLLIDDDCEIDHYDETIGLGMFFSCKQMLGVRSSQICQLPETKRKLLQERILNALNNQNILQLNAKVFRVRQEPQKTIQHILRYLKNPNVFGIAAIPLKELLKVPTINVTDNPNRTYLIYGDLEVEKVITTAYWLSQTYNVSRIIIIFTRSDASASNFNYMTRALMTLQEDKPSLTIELFEVPKNEKDNKILAQNIIEHNKANITAALMFSERNKKQDYFLATLLNKIPNLKVVYILTDLSINDNASLERYIKNFKTNISFLRCEKKCRFNDVVQVLDGALEKNVDIFVNATAANDIAEKNFSHEDFFAYLSLSIQSLEKWSPPSSVSINPVISASPREINDCPPVFIVPGIFGSNCQYLKGCLKQIYSPAFILDAAYDGTPLDKLAMRLAMEVCKVYPKGPYNIIGVSTGGALAIELAKYLEKNVVASVYLFLIDGVPYTVKQYLEEANSASKMANGYEIFLLEHLLRIKDPNILAKIKSAPPNWAARLNVALSYINDKNKLIERSLQAIKQRLNSIINYTPNEEVFCGQVFLCGPFESCTDYSYLLQKTSKQIKRENVQGNHFTMLLSRHLINYINEEIALPSLYH